MPIHDNRDRVVTVTSLDKMKNNIIVDELTKGSRGLEFSVEAPPGDNEILTDIRMDTVYDDYINHVNLDCLNDTDDPNTSPFDVIASKMVNVTPDGGVKKQVKKNGYGPVIPENAEVYLHYNCYFELEEVPFDSSYLRSTNPFYFKLGGCSSYPGFEIALASMAVGEKSQFLIQPQYAFKELGVPPRIPPNATLLLEVDLIKAVNSGGADDGVNENDEYEDYKGFYFAFKKAKALHMRGNDCFQKKKYNAAIDNYRKATNRLTSCSLANDEEENNQKHLLMKLYTNLCICYYKVNIPQKVCIAAREATYIDPVQANSNVKLQFHWGKALENLSDYQRASGHYIKALSFEPNNKEINQALLNLEKQRKDHNQHEKITYRRALGLDKVDHVEPKNKPSTSQEVDQLVKELKLFAKSSRSRLELPSGLTREEKQIIQETAESLGLKVKKSDGDTMNAVAK